jgi:hypothetical protein
VKLNIPIIFLWLLQLIVLTLRIANVITWPWYLVLLWIELWFTIQVLAVVFNTLDWMTLTPQQRAARRLANKLKQFKFR